jgi:hypothetical protein
MKPQLEDRENVVMCCLLRAIARLRGQGYVKVWSNSGMMVSIGKLKRLGEKPTTMPLHQLHVSNEVIRK